MSIKIRFNVWVDKIDGSVKTDCQRQLAVCGPLLIGQPPKPVADLIDSAEVQNNRIEMACDVSEVVQAKATI